MARKHIAWYTKGLKNSALFRARMNQLPSGTENKLAAVGLFFDALAERSPRLEYIDEVALQPRTQNTRRRQGGSRGTRERAVRRPCAR